MQNDSQLKKTKCPYQKKFTAIKAFCLIFLLLLADRITKYAARSFQVERINRGISFGLFAELPAHWIIIINILILVCFIIFCVSLLSKLPQLPRTGLAVLGAGILGNMWDRLLYGYVSDWLVLPFSSLLFTEGLAVNLADLFLIAGLLLFLVDLYRLEDLQPPKKP